MDNYHITKDGEKWKFQKVGSNKPTKTASTKQDIMRQAKQYMKNRTGSVKIHKVNGRIQEERTYPRFADPKRSRG